MSRQGFTLTEVLVTIVIIGILASASLVYYGTTIQRSRWDAAHQVVQTIYDAEQQYFSVNDVYTAASCASPQTTWRSQLNMDHPCPGASPSVTYNITVAGSGPTATFNATATYNAQTQTVDQNRAFGGTWVRP